MLKSVRRLGFIVLIITLALGVIYSIFFYQDGPLSEQIMELFSYTITAVVSFYFGHKIGDKKIGDEQSTSLTQTPPPSRHLPLAGKNNTSTEEIEETDLSNIQH
jgi:hypothetical protein